MRAALKAFQGGRYPFTATFEMKGKKKAYRAYRDENGEIRTDEDTILLTDVRHESELVCDHLWFRETKRWRDLDLRPGDVVKFTARATYYRKGYVNLRDGLDFREHDLRLAYPTHIMVVREDLSKNGGVSA